MVDRKIKIHLMITLMCTFSGISVMMLYELKRYTKQHMKLISGGCATNIQCT